MPQEEEDNQITIPVIKTFATAKVDKKKVIICDKNNLLNKNLLFCNIHCCYSQCQSPQANVGKAVFLQYQHHLPALREGGY